MCVGGMRLKIKSQKNDFEQSISRLELAGTNNQGLDFDWLVA